MAKTVGGAGNDAGQDTGFGGGGGNLSGPNGSNSGGGSQGGNGGPGTTDNGVPITNKPKPTTTPLPLIPDVEHQAPVPQDSTVLAAPVTPPARKPLENSALGGSFPSQAGITGYAGIFVP